MTKTTKESWTNEAEALKGTALSRQTKKPPALSFLEVQTASPCLNDRYPILVL
jgi:hypothetical protein